MNIQNLKQRFSSRHLVPFFLVCAFPFHLWKIIMLIRDSGWVIERSGMGSFFGLASQAMVYALVESALLFLLLLILGLLIPWKWPAEKVFALTGLIALWLPIWDILSQVYRHTDHGTPGFLVNWLFSTGHPLRYAYLLAGSMVLAVIALTSAVIWLVSFNHKVLGGMQNFLERIATLSAIYLVLDLVGVVIVIIRMIG
jgi:hypothetical protein